ncbi:putative dioxygenase [Aureobasidium subglaciale]|nr:putative dioxygenase [Aureobasidium subglaciale]
MSSTHKTTLEPEDTLNGAGHYDPNFTSHVISAIGPNTDPRLREVMTSLIQHIHDFAREVHLTVDEWTSAVTLINRAGQMSTSTRNEGQLLCDVIGLESLVDEITFKKAAAAKDAVTQSAILGPFFRHDAPLRAFGDSISFNTPSDAEMVYMHGTIMSASTHQPVEGAELDIWQASTNGLYEQQDPEQVEHNLRGKFRTRKDGKYGFYCIRPTPYPVPDDGPAGELLHMLDRHPYRPAHIHLIVIKQSFKPITTQIFDASSKYLDNDSVFAVKDSLIVDFTPLHGNDKAALELKYDIHLAPVDE